MTTPRKVILGADRRKVQVCLWSAGCIRWTKIIFRSCIMATMWHFYGDKLFIYGLGEVATAGGTYWACVRCKKWTSKHLFSGFLLRSDPFSEDILYFPICLGNTDWCCHPLSGEDEGVTLSLSVWQVYGSESKTRQQQKPSVALSLHQCLLRSRKMLSVELEKKTFRFLGPV